MPLWYMVCSAVVLFIQNTDPNSPSYIIGDENLLRTKNSFSGIVHEILSLMPTIWHHEISEMMVQTVLNFKERLKGQKELKLSEPESLVFGAVTSIACSAANTYNTVEIVTSLARAMWTNMCKKDQNWNTFWTICFNAYILAWFTCLGGILRLASNCTSHCFCECV